MKYFNCKAVNSEDQSCPRGAGARPRAPDSDAKMQAEIDKQLAAFNEETDCTKCKRLRVLTKAGRLLCLTHNTRNCRVNPAKGWAATPGTSSHGGEERSSHPGSSGECTSSHINLAPEVTRGESGTGSEVEASATPIPSAESSGPGRSSDGTEDGGTPSTTPPASWAGWYIPVKGLTGSPVIPEEILALSTRYVDSDYLSKPGKIGTVPVKLMFDNGAKRNLVKQRVIDALKQQGVWYSTEKEFVNLVGFGGGPGMLCRENVTFELSIECGKPVRHVATVTPNHWGLAGTDEFDGLVGLPYAQGARHRSIIFELDDQRIEFPLIQDEGVPESTVRPDIVEVKCVAQGEVSIPANQAAIVLVTASIAGGDYLVLPQPESHTPDYPVVPTVVSLRVQKESR